MGDGEAARHSGNSEVAKKYQLSATSSPVLISDASNFFDVTK